MKTSMVHILFTLLLPLFLIAKVHAEEAHIHGLATLTLALEGNSLEIEFKSPAANLVGFEHQAESAKEKQAVKAAEVILGSPATLFSFAGNGCQLKDVEVDISGLLEEDHDDHGHHHERHHSSHDDHKGHSDKSDSHSEIKAHYHFSCNQEKQLESVSTALFSQFPGIENINAMWVTDTVQGSKILAPNSAEFSLR